MKPVYRTGDKARKCFEETMHKLFRVPKPPKKEKPSKKAASEEKQN
jgi:hypothetical protein